MGSSLLGLAVALAVVAPPLGPTSEAAVAEAVVAEAVAVEPLESEQDSKQIAADAFRKAVPASLPTAAVVKTLLVAISRISSEFSR